MPTPPDKSPSRLRLFLLLFTLGYWAISLSAYAVHWYITPFLNLPHPNKHQEESIMESLDPKYQESVRVERLKQQTHIWAISWIDKPLQIIKARSSGCLDGYTAFSMVSISIFLIGYVYYCFYKATFAAVRTMWARIAILTLLLLVFNPPLLIKAADQPWNLLNAHVFCVKKY